MNSKRTKSKAKWFNSKSVTEKKAIAALKRENQVSKDPVAWTTYERERKKTYRKNKKAQQFAELCPPDLALDFRDVDIPDPHVDADQPDTVVTPAISPHDQDLTEGISPIRKQCHINRKANSMSKQLHNYNRMEQCHILSAMAVKIGVQAVFIQKPRKIEANHQKKLAVIQFYLSDEISSMAPGIKDVVTVRSEVGKETRQKLFMFLTLVEAYEHYKQHNTGDSIGKSLFCSLRPPEVISITKRQRCMCRCNICDNIKLLWAKLQLELPMSCYVPLEVVLLSMTCDTESKLCKLNMCGDCIDFKLDTRGLSVVDISEEDKLMEDVEVEQWSRGNKDDKDNTFKLRYVKYNLGLLMKDFLKKQLPSYLRLR